MVSLVMTDEEPLIPKPRLPSITMEERFELLREQLAIAQTLKNPGMFLFVIACLLMLFNSCSTQQRKELATRNWSTQKTDKATAKERH